MVVFNQQEAMRPIQIRMFQGLCSKTPMFNPMKQGDTLVPERILRKCSNSNFPNITCSTHHVPNLTKQGGPLVPERILKNGADDGDDADENGDDDAEDQMTIMMMMISAG